MVVFPGKRRCLASNESDVQVYLGKVGLHTLWADASSLICKTRATPLLCERGSLDRQKLTFPRQRKIKIPKFRRLGAQCRRLNAAQRVPPHRVKLSHQVH